MEVCQECPGWSAFLVYVEERLSATAFENWLAPIEVLEWSSEAVVLGVPNIFVQQYLLDNYRQDLCAFLPVLESGEPAVRFVIQERARPNLARSVAKDASPLRSGDGYRPDEGRVQLNPRYRFETFIEGPSNQFVKAAALGVAHTPGRSYNLLFMHGGVGLGKTHLLHSIGHYIREAHKRLRVHCITTEAFINDLVDALRNKSIDKMKRFYRSLDVLLVDDIQFLQNRLNFEEEFCNTFEALINRGGLIVLTSDKPPGQLKLSERIVARMEWGLVSSVNIPDLETRVAILLHKAEQKGLSIPHRVAFYIAEHIYSNVRQLEGAINRLSAHCRLLNLNITEELVAKALAEMLQRSPSGKVTVERILKSVATIFQVKVSDLTGGRRTNRVALPRQVAMYLAREMVSESLNAIGCSFGGKRHSTILHACDRVRSRMKDDEQFMRQVEMVRRNLEVS